MHSLIRARSQTNVFHFLLCYLYSVQDYDKFWENFGKHIKLGCIEDRENHKRIAPLLRFFSSQSDEEMISLDEYVENMKPDQKDIYYIAADSVASARNTPFLEKLVEKDIEVHWILSANMDSFIRLGLTYDHIFIILCRFFSWWILLMRLPFKI